MHLRLPASHGSSAGVLQIPPSRIPSHLSFGCCLTGRALHRDSKSGAAAAKRARHSADVSGRAVGAHLRGKHVSHQAITVTHLALRNPLLQMSYVALEALAQHARRPAAGLGRSHACPCNPLFLVSHVFLDAVAWHAWRLAVGGVLSHACTGSPTISISRLFLDGCDESWCPCRSGVVGK